MTDYQIVGTDENGKLLLDVFPATPPAGWAGSSGGGGPQEWAWHFPGALTVRTGLAVHQVPLPLLWPSGRAFKLKSLSAILGTLPNPSGAVSGRLAVNNSELQTFTIPSGQPRTYRSLTSLNVVAEDVLTVDITAVPASAVPAGDLTVAVWWEWA